MRTLLLLILPKITSAVLCYNCTSNGAGDPCQTTPRSTKWVECKGSCQVWKLYSEADSKTYMFERSCNEYCHQGCTHLADMEHRFVGCSSCCFTDFCNVGNEGTSTIPASTLFVFAALLLMHL